MPFYGQGGEKMRIFDQLNIPTNEFLDYEEYFGDMDLSDEEKEKRIALAKQFEVLFLYFFLAYSKQQPVDFIQMIQEKYITIALEFLSLKFAPAYIEGYARQMSEDIVRVTAEHNGEEFYTSTERGMLISANEANTLGNYGQQIQAIKDGKLYKTWVTEKDRKVRHTHRAIDEKKISIFEPFVVGNSLMMFPKDMETYGADMREIANCRCVVKYS